MPLGVHVCALAVASIYYLWRDGYVAELRRERRLCERVAFLLWTAALQDG
jgi:hypothetical protein